MKTKTLIIALLIMKTAGAQVLFQKTYPDPTSFACASVMITRDGGYALAGGDIVFGLLKTDSYGKKLWAKEYGQGNCYGGDTTSDGGFILTGISYNIVNSTYHFYIVKTDSAGEVMWAKTIDNGVGEGGRCIRQTRDKGYIMVGYALSYAHAFHDVAVIIKLDSAGDVVWSHYLNSGSAIAQSVQQTTDGGYIVAGYGNGIFLIKTDSAGQIIWSGNYGDTYGTSVQQTTDGGYILCGSKVNPPGGFLDDLCLVKTDSIGQLMWLKMYGGDLGDGGACVKQTRDGGFIVVGGSNSFADQTVEHVFLIKTDHKGNITWSKYYGDSANYNGRCVLETEDGYVVGGDIRGYGKYNYDLYLLQTDNEGNAECKMQDVPSHQQDYLLGNDTLSWLDSSGAVSQPVVTTSLNFAVEKDICLTTGIAKNAAPGSLAIYPNPFSGVFTVSSGEAMTGTISVFDLYGRMIIEENNCSLKNKKIDLSAASPGMYVIQLLDEKGKKWLEKLIKE